MLLILTSMVLLLVGMQHYLRKTQRGSEMDDSDNDRFRRQIDDNSGVLSQYNLFRRFFVEDNQTAKPPAIPRFFQGNGENRNSTRRSKRSSHSSS